MIGHDIKQYLLLTNTEKDELLYLHYLICRLFMNLASDIKYLIELNNRKFSINEYIQDNNNELLSTMSYINQLLKKRSQEALSLINNYMQESYKLFKDIWLDKLDDADIQKNNDLTKKINKLIDITNEIWKERNIPTVDSDYIEKILLKFQLKSHEYKDHIQIIGEPKLNIPNIPFFHKTP